MSQPSSVQKPSLQGVRIKARKGTVKAQAKHEPSVFRDQLYKHLETVPEDDFDGVANKLIQAGSTLEYLKYADVLFEILLVGGLLQPGGSYVEDGAPPSPFSVFKAKEPAQADEIKKYVEVFNKLIRRYKYLQKPLEETVLPSLLQYSNRWTAPQQEKFGMTVGYLMAQGLASASCLQSLTKDHLVKNDVSINSLTIVFRAFLSEQSMDALSGALKKGGIKDVLAFLPANKRDAKNFDAHFKAAGLPQVAEWYTKRQFAIVKDEMVKTLKEMCSNEDSIPDIIGYIKQIQEESPVPEAELVQCIWQGFISSIDWSARADQIDGLAVREISKYAPILEPFCSSAKTQVALINVVQVHCYEDTRVIKTFPQILKVLYQKDCVSEQAIIYWAQKGSKPQGRQHFLKATEPLVKFLQEQESEDEEEE